jgi:hypothetical protein
MTENTKAAFIPPMLFVRTEKLPINTHFAVLFCADRLTDGEDKITSNRFFTLDVFLRQ